MAEDVLAQLQGISGLDADAARGVLDMARRDPASAKGLLVAYQAAAADGTPNWVEEAWGVISVALGIATTIAGDVGTIAGAVGAVKAL